MGPLRNPIFKLCLPLLIECWKNPINLIKSLW